MPAGAKPPSAWPWPLKKSSATALPILRSKNKEKGDPLWCRKIKVTFAGHPIPDENSASGAQRILDIYRGAQKGDIVFFVTSGGGTALKALPAPGITLKDLQDVYQVLYFGCGATMPEANTMRNMLTVVRGKAAKHVRPAPIS